MLILLCPNEDVFSHTAKFHNIFIENVSIEDITIPHVYANVMVYYLQSEIHEWLNSYDAEYKLSHHRVGPGFQHWYISIPNKDVALLFKTTWC
jgi:hypothetical protein